jgi:pimeloyl-ACP methyl ester carboxylesterase
VVTIDLLGHGESDRPGDMWRYSMPEFGREIVALLDHLETPEAVVMGTSLGANATLEVAALAPERLRAARLLEGPDGLVVGVAPRTPLAPAELAALANRNERLICSVTHALYVPLEEALSLAAIGCVFELDAYTYVHRIDGRRRGDLPTYVESLIGAGALVYFTSDGGQAATGNPFAFGARVLGTVAQELGGSVAAALGVENPAALVARLGYASRS